MVILMDISYMSVSSFHQFQVKGRLLSLYNSENHKEYVFGSEQNISLVFFVMFPSNRFQKLFIL